MGGCLQGRPCPYREGSPLPGSRDPRGEPQQGARTPIVTPPCVSPGWVTHGRGGQGLQGCWLLQPRFGAPYGAARPRAPLPGLCVRGGIAAPPRRAVRQSRVLLQWAVDSFCKHCLLMLPRRGRQATGRIRKRRTSQMDCFPSLLHLSVLAGCLHACPLPVLPTCPVRSSARVTQVSLGGCQGAVPPR